MTVTGAAADGPAVITAAAAGATVEVQPPQVSSGTVGEVTVVPGDVSEGVPLRVTITAELAGLTRQEERSLNVMPGSDELGPEASTQLAPFITWLADNRPDLGITTESVMDGIPGSWVLIVNHYPFFSSDWEVDLEWHVMVPPDDWSRIYLRRRWSEVAPSVAFEISSVSGGTEPHEVEPPEAVWR